MKISKEVFAYILGLLEDDYVIEGYQFKPDNSIVVYEEANDGIYYFDKNNMLINPKVRNIQNQIERLQKELKELQEEEKKLLTKNN